MTQTLTIILISICLFSCQENIRLGENQSLVTIDSDLEKTKDEILDINWTGGSLNGNWEDGKIHPNKKYEFNYFNDKRGLCRLLDDTLLITSHQGYGPSNWLEIQIINNKFSILLSENNCTYSHNYQILNQRLSINKNSFVTGDSIIGELYCQAVYVWDSSLNIIDTTTISGKFKLKIRSRKFNADSLSIENNFRDLITQLSNQNLDTITKLKIYNTGLNQLPLELFNLKNLKELDLSGHDLKSVDLSGLASFVYLEKLNLRTCNLNKFPDFILSIDQLVDLEIGNNDINELPLELFQIASLKRLGIGYTKITELPIEIENLNNLEMLSIAKTPIRTLPKSILNLRNLNSIYPPDTLDFFPPELAYCLSHVYTYKGIKNFEEFKDQIQSK
jgi:hypothetical protein